VKVLIAEDDPVSSLVLSSKLKKLGYDVVATENGRDAWFAFQRENPRIVITDWMMPVLDGLELCRMIRADNREQYTYIIMLTALGGRGSYIEGMNAGADDFVTKPFDMEGLKARLAVAERILRLQSEVTQLEGLLPICSYCKKIRDENNVWHSVESFVHERTETAFELALCPDCARAEAANSQSS
jgi:sigma-B regulation protein RsbU (phosphoserine phosphatase)